MKYLTVILILLSSSLAVAKDSQEIAKRKAFCHKVYQYLEQNTGWNVWVRIAPGKEQNVLQLFPGADSGRLVLLDGGAFMAPDRFVAFKREVVEPLMQQAEFSKQIRELGFVAIQLKIASHSESFPKGIIDIPIERVESSKQWTPAINLSMCSEE